MSDALPATWPALSIAEAHARLTAPGARFELETIEVRGAQIRTFRHAPTTLLQVFDAGRAFGPDRTFLVYEDERVGYEAFARAALAVAAALEADGIRPGDRVAVAMRNLPEFLPCLFGAVLAGAVVVPLNAWWTAPELAFGLEDSGARIAFADPERAERIGRAGVPLERLYVCRAPEGFGRGDPALRRLEGLIGPPAAWAGLPDRAAPTVALHPDDDVVICYTSGTTGRPKGAVLSHRNVTVNGMTSAFALARRRLRRGEPVPAPDPSVQRTTLLAVPLFHVTGLCSNLQPLMMQGGKLVLMRQWDAGAALALIERERVNQTGGVPTVAWQLLEHPGRAAHDLSSLDAITYGGAPSAPELLHQLRRAFPDTAAGHAWGMTETGGTFTNHVGEDYAHRPWSCGPANPTGEVKVVDADGRALPPGEVGELCVRGPQVVRGYWRRPDADLAAFKDGWLRTGDLAVIDAEGFVGLRDRAKDMLIRGGENIYCIEVESALYEHPAVIDAAVIGRPHRTLGEEPVAVVTLAPGAQAGEAELQGFVRARLAAYKVPVAIHLWPGLLPRNANGKILKLDLKARLLAGRMDVAAEA